MQDFQKQGSTKIKKNNKSNNKKNAYNTYMSKVVFVSKLPIYQLTLDTGILRALTNIYDAAF